MFNCSYCTFISNRKFCVKQHEDNIHFIEKYDKPFISSGVKLIEVKEQEQEQ